MPSGIVIIWMLGFVVVSIDARVFCRLDCGDTGRCEFVRSTCEYPPCPLVPICVGENNDHDVSKPGQCPLSVTSGPCVTQCQRDGDCQGEEKCCFNGCGRTCRRPYQEVSNKPGTCPWHLQREPLCGMDCDTDQDCPGVEKCCLTSCGSTCSKPCYHWLRGTGTRSGFWSLPYICQRSFP